MEVAGAVDSYLVGEDIGKVCDMEEPLEIPITNDLTMVLGSISQTTAFGMRSVVDVPQIKLETVSALSAFCEKASMVSPGVFLLHQLYPLDPYCSNKLQFQLPSTTTCRNCRIKGNCNRFSIIRCNPNCQQPV